MSKEINAWDFVVAHYPDYYSCATIACNNDLSAIANDEYEYSRGDESDKAQLYCQIAEDLGVFEDGAIRLKAEEMLHESNALIYEKAITAFMETNNISYDI